MRPPWYFVLPADRDRPSGGNRYNEQLIKALPRAGQPVAVIDFRAYQRARQHGTAGCYWVDSLFVQDLAGLDESRPKDLQTVFILHHLASMDASSDEEQAARWKEEQIAFQRVDVFLVTSTFSREYLRAQGVNQPIMVVEPGMGTVLSPDRPTDEVSALMVANLVVRKGILAWLEALAEVIAPADAFTLTIVGRTDLEPLYAEACQRSIAQQSVLCSRVCFTGPLSYHEVEEYYRRSHLFVSAARLETFGMALQEAKAHRIPLLTLAGGYAERHVRSETDGYVFRSPADMAYFFVDLVRNPTRLRSWQNALHAQPYPTQPSWNRAAHQLIKQFNQGR